MTEISIRQKNCQSGNACRRRNPDVVLPDGDACSLERRTHLCPPFVNSRVRDRNHQASLDLFVEPRLSFVAPLRGTGKRQKFADRNFADRWPEARRAEMELRVDCIGDGAVFARRVQDDVRVEQIGTRATHPLSLSPRPPPQIPRRSPRQERCRETRRRHSLRPIAGAARVPRQTWEPHAARERTPHLVPRRTR